jgi:hypothetical protein
MAKKAPVNLGNMSPGLTPQQMRRAAAGMGTQFALPKPRQRRGGVSAKVLSPRKSAKGPMF